MTRRQRRSLAQAILLAQGLLLGAALQYLFDPNRGARRRGLARDRLIRARHRLTDRLGATARDLGNRAYGTASSMRSRFNRGEVSDIVLMERVRSALGRAASHPGSITVTADAGRVMLSGWILTHELEPLLERVAGVRGVREVVNRLEPHSSPGKTAGLHDGRSARLVGIAPDTPPSLEGRRHAIDVRKTITLRAPVEQVWELWSHFENFPRFMAHLREVRRITDETSHWVASGPAGVPVEWDAVVTEWITNEVIAWRSVEGSAIRSAGIVRFRPVDGDATMVDIRMSYDPPGGVIGRAMAALLSVVPEHALHDDMVRLKSLLESGKTTARDETVRLVDLLPIAASGAE